MMREADQDNEYMSKGSNLKPRIFFDHENCFIISRRGSHKNPRRLRQTELDLGLRLLPDPEF